jgi:hypothetical protein
MMYLERVGRRTLICAAFVTALAGVFYISRAPAQGVQFAPDPPKPPEAKQPGRYQIFMHPQFGGDQYLLDTATGQVWQLVKFGSLEGEPIAWRPMVKLDDEAQLRAFYSANRLKPDALSTPATSAEASRRSAEKFTISAATTRCSCSQFRAPRD